MRRRTQGRANSARALIIGHRLGDLAQHAKKEGAGACRGIGDGDILGGKALMATEQGGGARKASSVRRTMACTTSGGV